MSEVFWKSGLSKSAFKPSILEGLPLEYYTPYTSEVLKSLYIYQRRAGLNIRIKPKFYTLFDSFMMFYKDYSKVQQHIKKKPKKKSVWWKIIKEYTKTDEFYKLNRITSASTELSIMAGAMFLAKLLKKVEEQRKDVKNLQEEDKELEKQLKEELPNIAREVREKVGEYKELKDEAIGMIGMILGQGGQHYGHEGLSVMEYLTRPDEFRRKVRMLKNLVKYTKKFSSMISPSLQKQQIVSTFGGVHSLGVMQNHRQIQDLALTEYVMPKELFTLRILTKRANVYQRAVTVKPVVFVDKSGSMAETMPSREGMNVEKIAGASGLALALYLKLNAEVYLFDTEVEKVTPAEIVRSLLTIKASGGTRIGEVLEEIAKRGRKDEQYIIITDGIDEPSFDTIDKTKKYNIKFILIPPAWEKRWLKDNFKYEKINYVEDLIKAI